MVTSTSPEKSRPIPKQNNSVKPSGSPSFKGLATQPTRVRRVVKHLEDFKNHVKENNLSFSSWEEAKENLESFSQSLCTRDKASVRMDWRNRENDGTPGGLIFSLADKPSETISGVYLAKAANLHLKENYNPRDFHPDVFSESINLVEANEELDEELLEGEIEAKTEGQIEEEEDLDGFTLDDASMQDDIEQERGDGVSVPSSSLIRQGKPPRRAKEGSREAEVYEAKRGLNDVEHLGASVSRQGNEINGLPVIGMSVQSAAAAVAILGIGDSNEQRLRDLEKATQRLGKRIQNTSKRASNIGKPSQSVEEPETSEASETEPPPVELNPETETSAEPEESGVNPDPTESLTSISNNLGSHVNKLGKKIIDPQKSKDSELKPLDPLKIDPQAGLEDRLTLIEEYLNKLNDRLNELDAILERLEKQMAEQSKPVAKALEQPVPESEKTLETETTAKAKEIEANQPQVPANSKEVQTPPGETIEKQNAATNSTQSNRTNHTTVQTVETVESPTADTLTNYAWITREVTQESFEEGIALSDTKTLKTTAADSLEESNRTGCQVQIIDSQQGMIFEATKAENNQWSITSDNLSESDRKGIQELPKTLEAYESEAVGQAFVEHLKSDPNLSYLFNLEDPENNQATLNHPETGEEEYRIEVIPAKDHKRFFIEVINNDEDFEQVFAAVTEREPGKPTKISQNDIPTDYLESYLQSAEEVELENSSSEPPKKSERENPQPKKAASEMER